LTALILQKAGLFPFIVHMGDKPDYISALELANRGDLLPLIDYMLQKQNAIFETVELFD
jgi:hypothetical protein